MLLYSLRAAIKIFCFTRPSFFHLVKSDFSDVEPFVVNLVATSADRTDVTPDTLSRKATYHSCWFITPPAVRAGSFEMTYTLVTYGAWVEQVCRKKWTAMHEAAKVGNVDILMLLLRNGSRVNQRDVSGVTPLAVAAEQGHFHITEILLNCGQSQISWP